MRRVIVSLVIVAVFSLSPSTAWTNPCCYGDYDCNGDVEFSDYLLYGRDFIRGILGITPMEPCSSGLIPKTGQTTSYSTGDDGDLEKGVEWPNPRFTDNLDGTVTDNLTGLVWLKNANCFGYRSWHSALSDCDGLKTGFCDLTDSSSPGDWRLPNYRELFSLVDAENYAPALPTGHPFTNVQSNVYLSSTTWFHATDDVWVVTMTGGSVGRTGKSYANYVWPVRGGH